VLTVDQRHSRRTRDRVDALLRDLADRADLLRPFERTAGDEVQAVADRADVAVDLTLLLVRENAWSVGIGVGAVDEPLPASTRAGSGPAFTRARAAVTAAKNRATGLAVVGPADDGGAARRAQTALDLVAALLQRRTVRGAEAVALAREGLNQLEVAGRLGVSKQAVSQRLQAADWHLEVPGRELAVHLLSLAAGTVGGS
jgi:hypothetical protein